MDKELLRFLGPRMGTDRLMYIAHPTDFWRAGLSQIFCDHAKSIGYQPVNPFDIKLDEKDKLVGRPPILRLGIAIQTGCGETGIYDWSSGVVGEFRDRLNWDLKRKIQIFSNLFQPNWELRYQKFNVEPLVKELRGKNNLIVLVASRAAGKTFLMEKAIENFGKKLKRVRNFTTRAQREAQDASYYWLINKEQFLLGVQNSRFLEWVESKDGFYGSSLDVLKDTLYSSNGIYALTPSGAAKLWERRFEINVIFVVFKAPPEVLIKNLVRRNITDPLKQEICLKEAVTFDLPASIPHFNFEVTGTDYDIPRFCNFLHPFVQ